MNYTEKYHLPQWEENDRVLREDFNQMCAGMEGGLLETGQAAQEMLEKGLFRAAYNQYQLMSVTESWPRHLGACFRDFAERDGSGISGSLILDGKRWIANSEQMLTNQMLLDTMTCSGGFTSTEDSVKIRFTAPYAGVLNSIRADGGYENPNGSVGAYTASLRNLTTGVEESVYKGDLKIKNNTSGAAVYFFVYMVLHAKQRYELEIKLDKYDFTPKFSIDPKSTGILVVKCAESGESYTHYNFSDDIPSQGVLALVHYDTWGEGNSITVSWPNEEEEYEPTLVRQITDRHGRRVYEAEFRIRREVPGPGQVRFNFRCVPNGEISVYEWGAVLI